MVNNNIFFEHNTLGTKNSVHAIINGMSSCLTIKVNFIFDNLVLKYIISVKKKK